MLRIPRASVAEMEDLCFCSGGRTWCLVPEAQLVPDGVIPGADPEYRYGYVSPIQSSVAGQQDSTFACKSTGHDLFSWPFAWLTNVLTYRVVGMKAMERFYTVFDLANYRVSHIFHLYNCLLVEFYKVITELHLSSTDWYRSDRMDKLHILNAVYIHMIGIYTLIALAVAVYTTRLFINIVKYYYIIIRPF